MQVCWLVPDLEAAIDTWVPHRRRRSVLLVRRRALHRRAPPRCARRVPRSHRRHRLRRDLQIELVCQENDEPGVFRDLFPRGQSGLHHMALLCNDYEAERDAYIAAGAELAFEARSATAAPAGSTPRPRSASWSSCSSRAERETGIRRHARRRRIVGRHRPDHPVLTWAAVDLPRAARRGRRRPRRPPCAHRLRRDPHLRRARSALGPHGAALLASGAGKGTRIGVLAPDGALLLTTFYAALRIGALVTPISTLATPPSSRTSSARATPRSSSASAGSCAATSARPRGRPARPRRRHGGVASHPGAPTCGRSGSTTPPGCRGRARSTTCWPAPTAPTRRTTHCSPPSSARCRPATTRSSSTPRAARPHRRRWCTASGRSPASPVLATYFDISAVIAPCRCCRRSGWAASPPRCRC